MARVLIVGCGCRGSELASELARDGHVVRGTTRTEAGRERIEAAGAEAVVADPNRLATLTQHLDGVSVLCWLLGSASGDEELVAALHGPRLESLLDTLVDTHVRGFVYEASGSAPPELLGDGTELARAAGERHRMPVEIVLHDPADHSGWTGAMAAAVGRVLDA